MAAELIVKIGAQVDDFKKGMAEAQSALSKGVQSFQNTATQFAIAGGAITAALGLMVRSSMQEEEAIAKVARAVTSSQKDFEATRQVLAKFGNEMEEKFPFSASQYMDAMQTLITKGHLPLDKAMESSTAFLRFMTDTGMESRRALMYINQEAKMGHDVLSEYAKKAELTLSPLEKLKVASQTWGNIMEDIGAIITPILLEIAGKVRILKDWWDKISPSTKQWAVEVIALTGVIMTLIGVLGKLAGLIVSIISGIGGISVAVRVLLPELVALGVALWAINEAMNRWDENIKKKSLEDQQKQIISVAEAEKKYLAVLEERRKAEKISPTEYLKAKQAIIDKSQETILMIKGEEKADANLNKLKNTNLSESMKLIQKYYKDLANASKDNTDKQEKEERRLANEHISILKERAGADDQYFLDLLTSEQKSTKDKSLAWKEYEQAILITQERIATKNKEVIKGIVSDFTYDLLEGVRTGTKSLQEIWQGLVDAIIRSWERMIADMIAKWIASGIADAVKNAFTQTTTSAATSSVASAVTSAAGNAGGAASAVSSAILPAAAIWTATTAVGTWLQDMFSQGMQKISFNQMMKLINMNQSDLISYYEKYGNDFSHLALGGIVTKPTVAMIGEAGPEAVLPLSQLSNVINKTSTDNRNVTVNIYGGNKTPYQLYQELQPYIDNPNSVRRLGAREYFR